MTKSAENGALPELSRRRFLTRSFVAAAVFGPLGGWTTSSALAQPPAGPPRVDPRSGLEGLQKLLKSPTPATWILTGDSITHGALHTLGWRSYPEHFAERVRWELRRVKDVVINTGISGNRTGDLLADFAWRAGRFQPDVVSIMLGMNDCTAGEAGREMFRKNLAALCDRAIESGAIPLLHSPNTIYLRNAGGRSDLPAYARIVQETAADRGVALVDHWQHWQQAKPDQESLLPWLEDKSIHPGVYGHREMAKLMFRVLGIYDEASPTCRLETP
ncbi:MAG: SGNH/GDSL hydrolase family protein [Pirellulales bacterium]